MTEQKKEITVRIHLGTRTEAERKEALEKASIEFFCSIWNAGKVGGK